MIVLGLYNIEVLCIVVFSLYLLGTYYIGTAETRFGGALGVYYCQFREDTFDIPKDS